MCSFLVLDWETTYKIEFFRSLTFEEAAKGGKQKIDLKQYGGEIEVNIPAGTS